MVVYCCVSSHFCRSCLIPVGTEQLLATLLLLCRESTVESHFSQYGDIESAEVIHDRVTGKSRGFGFVTFPDSLAAEHALSESHTINGRRCDVKAAVPKVKVKNGVELMYAQ